MAIHFIASIEETRLSEIQSLAKQLEGKGCHIHTVLTFAGIITGSVEDSVSLDILKLDGIKHVEIDKKVKTQ